MKAKTSRGGIACLLLALGGCNQLADIHPGVAHGGQTCRTNNDCTVDVPECRAATCEYGLCLFEDAVGGTPLLTQTMGDCALLVCDGAGGVELIPLASDLPDDHDPCTLDACSGASATHDRVTEAPCYTGPAGTAGRGVCAPGIQYCDAQGNPIGGCEGQVLPSAETCASEEDDDCDGAANEEGDGCVCGDGYISVGESCDDHNTAGGDSCNSICRIPVVKLALGRNHACAILMNGTVKCWGLVWFGENGSYGGQPGDMGDNLPEVTLGAGRTAMSIATTGDHTCVLLDDGRVKCWGNNQYGQLGLGHTEWQGDDPREAVDSLPAVDLGVGKMAVAIAAGSHHTCALLNDGSVKCWGDAFWGGQLGLGDKEPRGDEPGEMGDSLPAVNLGSGGAVSSLVAGERHTCVLLDGGQVKCWGDNLFGQLGLGLSDFSIGDEPGEMGDALPAVDLGTGRTAVSIATGRSHTCALLDNATLKCWGDNAFGALGLGTYNSPGSSPGSMGDNLPSVDLGPAKTAIAVAAGGFFT